MSKYACYFWHSSMQLESYNYANLTMCFMNVMMLFLNGFASSCRSVSFLLITRGGLQKNKFCCCQPKKNAAYSKMCHYQLLYRIADSAACRSLDQFCWRLLFSIFIQPTWETSAAFSSAKHNKQCPNDV